MPDTPQFISTMKPFIQRSWEKAGFEQGTPIQLKAIPLIAEGKDLIAESPTGTGKTLAYLLPLLEKIDPEKKSIQAVILASSRELVMQIAEEIRIWSEGSDISGAAFIGGANVKRQLEKLKKRPQIIAGTPGRIYELIAQKKIKMHEVKTMVLDEGDQLLVSEHIGTIHNIVKSTLKDRQVLMFSATLPAHTEKLAQELTNKPETIRIGRDENIQSKVDHIYFVSEKRDKISILEKIARLKDVKGLAFAGDIAEITVISEKFVYKGLELGVLHGDSSKMEREKSLKNLRSGKSTLLLATDVAARGLDIKGLTTVIHVDLPENTDQYVHRSGRTGRAGAGGTVISIVTEREERELKKITRELGISPSKKTFYRGEIIDAR
ncbi:DEAD/DEAH box helicase [Peribacillus cavernae]|uniref:DEAD/DEAH box helicase n=1 Tax=Peribacillus cavernae TaxID=1674310 RepID=A0A3S0VIG5_9BACI|nr:DEAD/DEAH box helicase [Peribacillus cavernae]MDQ0219094.1 superfamily II DNA/RNA helicase [Peribacillus cavernae]RUQ28671.1 DEAD/DEAH box helicase [Peribacillus cavernae]